MTIVKNILAITFGLGAGVVIAGAVFAFIAIIGIVPRLAQKTDTQRYGPFYEEAIMFGGIFGTILDIFKISIPIGKAATIFLSFCGGIFIGCLAMSLAEVLDVIPIMTRRVKVQQGMFFFVLCIALGKLIGSLGYFIIPGFYEFP